MFEYPLSKPFIGDNEIEAVERAIRGGWVSGTGPQVKEFETALAWESQRKYAVATANGTLALQAALMALSVGAGDRVIVPALTFAAPINAVLNVGAVPVIVDIDPVTWCIDAEKAAYQAAIYNVKALIAVNLMGHLADYDDLSRRMPDIPIIEDAAESHGAWGSFGAGMGLTEYAGSFGVMSTFSFHANKAITTGEGGAVLTNEIRYHERLKMIVNHGMRPSKPYYHELVGSNFRMGNLAAALGCAQVERWHELILMRGQVAAWYAKHLPPSLTRRPPNARWCIPSTWLYCCTVEKEKRGALLEHLRKNGIDARSIWPDLPSLPLYMDFASIPCPVARDVSETALWLPTYNMLQESDIQHICDVIQAAF